MSDEQLGENFHLKDTEQSVYWEDFNSGDLSVCGYGCIHNMCSGGFFE